ncbi:CFA_G0015480.mRNA.1.CDS.1 [Saccharomyces cerevisiae]|nr:CFA_G0015480.mRNA.1.CDS.1 [Saccharomyces cerevisiae]CAI7263370.1 CFA_G0015480.mRNA.1.CDS.1 [Saccharomyces cerevisiae]
MATKQAHKRLTKEYKLMVENPPPYILARPNEDNILEWHYIITGPADTPYKGGQYHGTLTFPSDYPYKPPAIRMVTPNGRFKPNTRLCLSMSDYHPDTWNPGWSVSTILNGLLSFMTSDEATTGSITTSDHQKKTLARNSISYNTFQNVRFKLIFPEVVQENVETLEKRKLDEGDAANTGDETEDPFTKAAKEKVISLEEILDPEDRIRAEQALRQSENNSKKDGKEPNGSSSMVYIGIAIFLFLVGLFMK